MAPDLLHIASDLALPTDYVTKTVGILAQRRKGKTYTANVIAEEFVATGLPFVALDPTGAWWGLRASADASGPGLPVTILGGQHGDVPLDRTDGKGVAELVVDEPGWYVIDFSLFESNAAEVQFATDFAQRLYRRKGQPNSDFPMHLFVDEADRFVPQVPARAKGEGGETTMLGAFEAIVRRGGLRGLGTTLISQRSAVVNKNVLEQCDVMIVLRTVGPNDRDRIMEIVSAEGTKEQIAEVKASMASLDLGEAWFWEPGEGLFQRIHVRERRTFNSSATPKPGEKRVEPKRLASIDLEAIKGRWAEQIERAKAEDPAELKKVIATLRKQLAERPTAEPEVVEKIVEKVVPVEIATVPVEITNVLGTVRGELYNVIERVEKAMDAASTMNEAAKEKRAEYSASARNIPRPSQPAKPVTRAPGFSVRQPARGIPRDRAESDPELTPYAAHLLATLAARHPLPLNLRQWSVAADRSSSSSAWDPAERLLRKKGYVRREGDKWVVTEDGLAVAGVDIGTPPPSGIELVEWWCERITGPNAGSARTALRILFDEPEPLSIDEIADAAGWSRTSSGPAGAVATLTKLGLTRRENNVVYLDEQFR